MSEVCKLCGAVGALCVSHIVPDFYLRSMLWKRPTGSAGQPQPFTFMMSSRPDRPDGLKQRGHWEKIVGLTERLLCPACEARFQVYEVYARNLLYGNAAGPLKKLPLGASVSGLPVGATFGHLLDVRQVAGVDYRKLRLFQLSLLWRASVASGSYFEDFSIGNTDEAIVREMLHCENPGEETNYCCVMIDLQHKGRGCEDFLPQPQRQRDPRTKHYFYAFVLGGYYFNFHVPPQNPPEEALACCVKKSGEMLVLVANAGDYMGMWATKMRQAGKL